MGQRGSPAPASRGWAERGTAPASLEPALGPRPRGRHAWPRSLSLTPQPLRDAPPARPAPLREKHQDRPGSSGDTPPAWLPHPHPRGNAGSTGPPRPSPARAGSPWREGARVEGTLLFRVLRGAGAGRRDARRPAAGLTASEA